MFISVNILECVDDDVSDELGIDIGLDNLENYKL